MTYRAALLIDGTIYAGQTHADAFSQVPDQNALPTIGFVDEYGKFYTEDEIDRISAYGQVKTEDD